MNQYCPACAEEIIPAFGNPQSDYLIVEEFPELCLPSPKTGFNGYRVDWTPKKIMDNELSKVALMLQWFRIVPVFPHLPPDDGTVPENCYNFGLGMVRKEMENKKGIIILGTNLCKEFTGYELKQVQGLSGVPFAPSYDVVNCPRVFLQTIRSIYSTGAGEHQVGLQRFVKQLKGE